MATINPWEGNPYDTGRPTGQGAPSIEELFQQGNVQVSPREAGPDPRATMAAQQLSDYSMRDRSGVTYGGAETTPGYAPGSTFFLKQGADFFIHFWG